MTESHGKTALITGASRGLGLALARALAERGWTLIIDARSDDVLEEVRGELARLTPVTAVVGDIADVTHRCALAAAAAERGPLHAVVNNAGILGPSPLPSLLRLPLDAFEELLRVNVVAPLGVVQAVRDHLAPGARVLNITSDAAVTPYTGWGGYGASKAALEQWSAILAVEQPELRVYWVDPGDMRTRMQQDAFPGEDIHDRPLPEERVPGLLPLLESDLPSGRYEAAKLGAAVA